MPLDTALRCLETFRNCEFGKSLYGDTQKAVHGTLVIDQSLKKSSEVLENPRSYDAKQWKYLVTTPPPLRNFKAESGTYAPSDCSMPRD